MNIYIHLEISARELDSKLLLAVIAANRGHKVFISDIIGFNIGLNNGLLKPGIFHTKSITPSETKITKHQKIIDTGFMITSIDEEHGLLEDDYEIFAKGRFSEESFQQVSAIFCWGPKDSKNLKQLFPKYLPKIYETGSPRVDLWKTKFFNYWEVPKKIPKKPFVLVASNIGLANNIKPFFEIIKSEKKAGYYSRDPNLFEDNFVGISEDYKLMYDFLQAIEHLSKYNCGYDIVVRPHPVENLEAWKTFLEGVPNVHVIHEGSISPWVKNAFAVIHNGCTTAIEATVSEKPVLTYVTFEQKYSRMLGANKVGVRVESPEELLDKVNELFDNSKSINKDNNDVKETISQLMYFDKNELAAEKIIKVWETFSNKNLSQFSSWNLIKLRWILKSKQFKIVVSEMFKKLFLGSKMENKNSIEKFPPFDFADINGRIRKLENILGIKKKLNCKFISKRTILIKSD
jgi:surface carbohydrate biosynthesis protein